MTSRTTKKFWACYANLPAHVKQLARDAYKIFEQDPFDPRLRFQRKHGVKDIWSVWVGIDYRALGVKPHADEIVWFWIGSHADYDKVLP